MSEIVFTHSGQSRSMPWGGHYTAPRAEGFRDTPAAELRDLVAEIDDGRPWREVVRTRYATANPWLYQIITATARTRFFDSVLTAGHGPALDLGSGWGQIARPLAAQRPVVALEPVAERLAFIRAAAAQDGIGTRLACLTADYFDVSFETKFELICAIGVLEWAGTFQPGIDPQTCQQKFLAKTRQELAPGGALILGIENRLGLKYLLGVPDDHLGRPGIACRPAPLARQHWTGLTGGELRSFTYSQPELTSMLRAAGYRQAEFWGAFPDYKLPARIIPLTAAGTELNGWLLANVPPREHNGYDGSAMKSATAIALSERYVALARAGIAHRFVPSFFVRAT